MSTRNVLRTSGYSWAFAEDYIRFKAMADSSGNLKVPTAWYSHTWSQNCPYNWRINYDNWSYTQYVGTGWTWSGKCITIATWLEANSEHIVELRTYDILNNYWRALAFWWYNSSIADRLLEIIVDSTYLGFAVDWTTTWNYFRYHQYHDCVNLRNAYDEYLPATVLDTWVEFRTSQYQWCRSLLTPWTESAPNSIIEIKDNFRMHQYDWCTSLLNSSVEVMPNTVTVVWQHFRWWQYCWCSSITTAAAEVLPPTLVTIKEDFRCNQYENCTNLVTVSDEYLPNTVTTIKEWFRLCQFRNCTKLTHWAKEAMSSSLTSLDWHFRHQQYENCTAIVRLDVMSVPNSLTSHSYCRYEWLNNTWSRANPMTIYCHWERVEYWDSSSYLDWARVERMYVPRDLVEWYRNNGFWSMVADEKIVWYDW